MLNKIKALYKKLYRKLRWFNKSFRLHSDYIKHSERTFNLKPVEYKKLSDYELNYYVLYLDGLWSGLEER